MKSFMKRFIAVVAAMVMVLAMGMTAMAAGNASITITPPASTTDDTTNTYKIYKVFDAVVNSTDSTKISYKLVEGKTEAPTGFDVDEAGNVSYAGTGTNGELTANDIEAIKNYVADDEPVATASSKGTALATATNLDEGYYYIATSTGSVVTIDSTNANPTVNDKNTVPTVKKTVTSASSYDADGKKALAEVGSTVSYQAVITVGKGAKNYVFHDTMGTGLTYNNDASVSGLTAEKYTVKETADAGDTLTITFADGIAENTEITITYSATVNSDALTADTGKNTAKISYGDSNTTTSTPSDTEVYNAKMTVTKVDGDGNALAGAGFKLKKTVTNDEATLELYYKLENNKVTWVSDIKEATEVTTEADDNGNQVAIFAGLADGEYTLIESTVPAGYNKAADTTFSVVAGNYGATNLVQTKTIENKVGTELPSTGGMGTTIFYILGGILVVAAGVVLVARRRMSR